jgi:F-type H+-transporting ATPase subunit delta
MRSSAAARRYARALFSLANETQSTDAVRGELDDLTQLFAESPELEQALFRPLRPVKERAAVLKAICERLQTSDTVRRFCGFLVDQRRLVDFDGIREEYQRLADQNAGRARAEVLSAGPLADDQRERLRRALSERTGKDVELDVRVDPTLIAGAVASVGTLVFDGSLRTQLEQLRASLTKGQ